MRLAVTISPLTLPATVNPTPLPTVAGGTAGELSCMWAPSVACAWLRTIMCAVAILPVVPLPVSTLLCACVCVCACAHGRVRANGGRYGHSRGTAATGGIYSSAATDTCAFALVIGRPPICAAGVTWTSRTTSAPWAARQGHTTVIDAAGAIYVIGGFCGTTICMDVWVSTDGGADRTRGEELL
jgi:hypothetical protein